MRGGAPTDGETARCDDYAADIDEITGAGGAIDPEPNDPGPIDPRSRRSVRAWITYDWANSAFATTILAAVLPVYYSSVAGSNLPSAATATQYYSLTASAAVLMVAIISPLLGAVADATGTRKRLLLSFAGIGIIGTAGLYAVNTGDWLLASALIILGRIGYSTSIVFYDALLPYVAPPDQRDQVSARGYAWGYLGGGLLLVANAAMIIAMPDNNLGYRVSFLSVAVWWALFSVPLARSVPEPPGDSDPSAGAAAKERIRETWSTLRGLGSFPDLRRYLLSFVVYNDAINAVIVVAAIYGVELGFNPLELTLAILLVQFVGVPFAIVFGNLVSGSQSRRRVLVGFVVANIVLLPLAGVMLRLFAPADQIGGPGPTIEAEGNYDLAPGTAEFEWEGQSVQLTYSVGPEYGEQRVLVDGAEATTFDANNSTERDGENTRVAVDEIGPHRLTVEAVAAGQPTAPLAAVEVLPATRRSSIALIAIALLGVQLVAALFALTVGRSVLRHIADSMTTQRAILLSLVAYVIIAIWGSMLDSVIEFWLLAWTVGVVQGGSQALSRSLYSRLIPASRSGEYFGFFSIVSKFASFLSPLVFAVSVALFGSSRPAVATLAVFFGLGIWGLRGVNVERGERLVAE